TGLPRVEELFEARKSPKGEALIADIAGTVSIKEPDVPDGPRTVHIKNSQVIRDEYEVPGNWSLKAEDGTEMEEDELIASRGDSEIRASHAGRVSVDDRKVTISYDQVDEAEYDIPASSRLLVADGDKIEAGMQLTEGSINPHRILRIMGTEAAQKYLLGEVQKVYRSQGQNINDKHFEVIISKMLSKVQVTHPGDTDLLPGDLLDRLFVMRLNRMMIEEDKQPARVSQVLLGITKASLNTESFLSAASFQHTIKVLSGAAIEGKVDHLRGLKENVIIGALIPAGTGFPGVEKVLFDERLHEETPMETEDEVVEPEAVAAD
ncbi:MAG: DNA-directed RNA polymerase subunit beta', partial [Anaerolineales bacterium]